MRQGDVGEFLKLVDQSRDLQKKVARLAFEFDFEFKPLDASGGGDPNWLSSSQAQQLLANLTQKLHQEEMGIIRNIR